MSCLRSKQTCNLIIFICINSSRIWKFLSQQEWPLSGPYLEYQSNFHFFYLIPYFGWQGQCLGMKLLDNLHTQVAFVTGPEEHSEPLGDSQASLIKHLTVPHSNFFLGVPFSKVGYPYLGTSHFWHLPIFQKHFGQDMALIMSGMGSPNLSLVLLVKVLLIKRHVRHVIL